MERCLPSAVPVMLADWQEKGKTMKRKEMPNYYSVVRYVPTDLDFLVEVVTVETVFMTWSDFVKYAKKKYDVKHVEKRLLTAVVA